MKKIYAIFIAALISLLLVSMKNPAKAVTVHANSQTNGTTAITCTSCSISNPGNAVDNNVNTYSSLNVNLGILGGYAWQRMVFPSGGIAGSHVGVIVEDPSGGILTLGLLGSFSIQTFNGGTSNSDVHSGAFLSIGLLGGSTTKYYVEYTAAAPFDRVEVRLSAGIASTFTNLRIYDAYHSPAPLPVELLSFNVKADGSRARITWSTAQERNSDLFVIERSKDAANYAIIGSVKAAGNSSKKIDYAFNDNGPLSPGTYYYRLKEVDQNGDFVSYGPLSVFIVTKSLAESENISIRILPDGNGNMLVDLHNLPNDAPIDLNVYSVNGSRILGISFPAGTRPESYTIPAIAAGGLYITSVLIGGENGSLLQGKFIVGK